MCGFPAALHGHTVALTTCTNGRDTTWDVALDRGYTLMPKPYTQRVPAHVKAPNWPELIRRAWRSRHQHSGLLSALRKERTTAKEQARQDNERASLDHQAAKRTYQAQWKNAQRTFRERHL